MKNMMKTILDRMRKMGWKSTLYCFHYISHVVSKKLQDEKYDENNIGQNKKDGLKEYLILFSLHFSCCNSSQMSVGA
jgi:hypothetical protein